MRKFIRHPSDVPIEFAIENIKITRDTLSNISVGGLALRSDERIEVGLLINVAVPTVHPPFLAKGRVAWCLKRKEYFDIGVQFVEKEDTYRVRMVEQICHIEHYKKEILENEGRILNGEEAALEWIAKYASDFPALEGR
ncbi:hypothetical protein MNBD_GAMMA16-154 [hydrothermal vent metagenome]|uniref:PilZ domain-containing protein n=1 Tax=hydrothermal vent metagenome TaxID=652676 RepID=A0A3B0YWX6_9ZZZZ